MSETTVLRDVIHRFAGDLGLIRLHLNRIYETRSLLLKIDAAMAMDLSRIDDRLTSMSDFILILEKSLVHSNELKVNDTWNYIELAVKRIKIPDRIALSVHRCPQSLIVYGTDKIIDIIDNLISNAIDAMPNLGRLKVYEHVSADGKYALISIEDTGDGVPSQVQEKMFVHRVSTKQHRDGLGLWWSKVHLEQIGGDILMETTAAEGSKFIVIIPLTISDSPADLSSSNG